MSIPEPDGPHKPKFVEDGAMIASLGARQVRRSPGELTGPPEGMAYQHVNQFGQAYVFGLDDPSAPTINGLKPLRAETKYEAPVFKESMEGEGHTDGVTVSKPDKTNGQVTVSGYVTNLALFNLLPGTTFEFESRFWIVRSVSKPRVAGELLEASLEASSFALVTGPA